MLELYQAEGCPYSEKVREKMTELGVSYVAHNPRTHGGDVRDESAHEQLLELGGEDQIPFLVDPERDVAMYESDDIAEYLDEHYA
ncbi:glutathione S-transferase N-terminal domain-containing protein [Halomicrobium salinisoli]|uniref:glutathione S-transferase N-terminal domain-containing protein n=1 Tax=Halomicrobium salinisoli TaxID=2878391 RepID=UPI001CF02AB4|nr:glutathione S-transferase N-terminal domain-containing protein [Halomicrobium salinisoli]